MTQVSEAAPRTRAEVTKRSFKTVAGEYVGRASTSVAGLRIELVENGQVYEYDLADFQPEVLQAAAAFGIVTSVTNAIGGKNLSVEERMELIEDRFATLLEGEWAGERQSGPRSSQLLDAIVQVRLDNGKESTQEWKDELAVKLKDEEGLKDKYLNNPLIRAALEKIKAEAAAKRAQAAAEKASNGSADLDDILAD